MGQGTRKATSNGSDEPGTDSEACRALRRTVQVHELRAARVWSELCRKEGRITWASFRRALRLVIPVGRSGAVVVLQWPEQPELWEVAAACDPGDLAVVLWGQYEILLACVYMLGCRALVADVELEPRMGAWLARKGWTEVQARVWVTRLVRGT